MLDAPTTNPHTINSAVDPTNQEAWEEINAIYQAPIRECCNRNGLHPTETDDVVQEVLIRLANRLAKSRFKPGTTSLRAWLGQVINQLIFETYRQRRKHEFSAEAMAQIQEWLPAAMAPEWESQTRQRMEGHLWAVCLARTRHRVLSRHWQIFDSHALQGLSASHVATIYNTSAVNVRIIRMRIVRKIRKEWKRLSQDSLLPPIVFPQ